MSRAFVTGASGFAGAHLCRMIVCDLGVEVRGVDIGERSPLEAPGFSYKALNILDQPAVQLELGRFKPDYVFHLAAQSSVARSWKDPDETFRVNGQGSLNVLEACAGLDPAPRVVAVCSGEEYGMVGTEDMPLTEEQAVRPTNPYAASKVFQDYVAGWYGQVRGLPVLRTRAFNHTGPGQRTGFVCSDFASQIASIEAGLSEPVIRVGNLEAERDFSDVRDIVRAYWLLAKQGVDGEAYNVCSGRARRIQEMLDMLLELSSVSIEVVKDPEKNRPADIPLLVGDSSKLRSDTGWEPSIPIEQSLSDLLDSYRSQVPRVDTASA